MQRLKIRSMVNRMPLLAALLAGDLPHVSDSVPQCGGPEWYKGQPPKGCGYRDTRHPDFEAYANQRNASGNPGAGLFRREDGVYPEAHCRCELAKEKSWRVEREAAARRLASANLPEWADETGERTFGKFFGNNSEYAVPRDTIASWARGDGPRILVLVGKPGTGKTHLIEAGLREALGRGHSARYEFVPALLDALRDTIGVEGAYMSDVMKPARDADFLALDDLGFEKASEWVAEKVGMLIDERLRSRGKRLIVATNNPDEEIALKLGERIASRLFDGNASLVKQVTMPRENFRWKAR